MVGLVLAVCHQVTPEASFSEISRSKGPGPSVTSPAKGPTVIKHICYVPYLNGEYLADQDHSDIADLVVSSQ